MSSLAVTPVYAAILALLYIGLSVRVIRARRRGRVALGDGGDEAVQRAMRVHGNFAEYVPLALLLIAFVEAGGGPPSLVQGLVHGLAAALLAGRIVHAFGVSRTPEDYRFRVAGMVLTFTALAGAALAILAVAVV